MGFGIYKNWLRRVWYGSAHPGHGAVHLWLEKRMKWFCLCFLVFAVLSAVRYLLPFNAVDEMMVHQRIVDALLGGQNWGRQALTASHEFPLLPTVGLLAADVLARPFQLDGGRLLVSVAQVCVLGYLIRLGGRNFSRRCIAVLVLAASLLIPFVRSIWLFETPHWITAVPLVAAVYHGWQWHKTDQLRSIVVTAISGGALVFCGLTGICVSLMLIGMLIIQVAYSKRFVARDRFGVQLLLGAPFLYCLVLLHLLSWLIMGDAFIAWQRLVGEIRNAAAFGFYQTIIRIAPALPAVPLAAVVIGAVTVKTYLQRTVFWMVSALLSAIAAGLALNSINFFPGGFTVITVTLCISVMILTICGLTAEQHTRRVLAGAVIAGVFILWSIPHEGDWLQHQTPVLPPAPAATEITTVVDRFWPQARIVVPGLRAAAIYGKADQNRFLPSVDFYEKRFLDRAADEQLFLLIPPRNSVFYPPARSVPADIHRHGRPWLLLEKQWRSGWQLWRCVITPTVDE